MPKQSLKSLLMMTAILLLAAFLRIYGLKNIPNGLIQDEAMRGYDTYSLAKTGADSFGIRFPLFLRGFEDYTPALYSYLSAPFMAIMGLSAFSTRLASAVAGIFTVALTYQLIRHPFGQTAALAGAFLLAISPWHILTSRTGTEWNLLPLGTLLTIALAYRGLNRPRILMVAGVVGGLALYGYAPVKAFLPILMAGFVGFYWHKLYQQKQAATITLLAFIIISIPIYTFSFSTEGLLRLKNVYTGTNTPLIEVVPKLIRNYFSYFSPDFLFSLYYKGIKGKSPVELGHLQAVGLLYWFELPFILLGLIRAFFSQRKSARFILFWLVAAPIGINLHNGSPSPNLWLTAIPIPQALAGAGFAWLITLARHPTQIKSIQWLPPLSNRSKRVAALSLAIGLGLGILAHFGVMVHDLFYRFPTYGAEAWVYGRGPSIKAMETFKDQFDEVIVASENLTTSIYLLFYTQYAPTKRHAELAQTPGQIWQNIDNYNIGNVRDYIQRPGCHLILTSIADAEDLKTQAPHLITLRRFELPDGRPIHGLYALPRPSSSKIEVDAVFGDAITLQGFAPVAPADPTGTLRPNQAICLIVQWQALRDITTDYTVFVHLTGPFNPATSAPLWAQHDSIPAYGKHPTSNWHTGDTIQDPHILIPPSELPPGQYNLEIGLYDPLTGERLPVRLSNGDVAEKVILMELNISN